jgi:hypothetical protein
LRVYAFDPSLAIQLETAVINSVTLKVPWEANLAADARPAGAGADGVTRADGEGGCGAELQPGPVGEYLEVIDYDPASGYFYDPVDLNDPALLAQDGLPPSEGNPQFHQQMVYAVVMTTIRNFERALGRLALWSPQRVKDKKGAWIKRGERFVRRLRVYPHALREANAYYSPGKKALLFGYFPASPADLGGHLPGGMVFTCLSHDIVAHEASHALLDGLYERLVEGSNPDALAFHEAFADIVALLQHFSLPDVLKHEIAQTRGDLQRQNRLGQLAQQFGRATGGRGALRSAIGRVDPKTGRPDPTEYARLTEPHARGSILVAAVFDAFVAIYKARVAALLRVATGGSGVLPRGELHPDLVNLLAAQAGKTASHLLSMCIRALDYCPPVDLTFGEYLRAIVTADVDLVPDDDLNYRVAFIEAFRHRGIYPRDVRALSEETLLWAPPPAPGPIMAMFPPLDELLKRMPDWDMSADRAEVFLKLKAFRYWLNRQFMRRRTAGAFQQLGLDARLWKDAGGEVGPIEVHSARPARRIGPDGQQRTDLVVVITQGRPVYFDGDDNWDPLRLPTEWKTGKALRDADFWYRGGCTLLIDLQTGEPRYSILKSIDPKKSRLRRQAEYEWSRRGGSLAATYFGGPGPAFAAEPFALLHRSDELAETAGGTADDRGTGGGDAADCAGRRRRRRRRGKPSGEPKGAGSRPGGGQ